MIVRPTNSITYRLALAAARASDSRIAEVTTKPEDMPRTARYCLSADFRSGFGVSADGELIGLFSTVKGRGADLIGAAVANGADKLDCFDGFLPSLYARFGFVETAREPNWTPGGPDVVFMALDTVA
jgi:hypothetical protein